LANRGWSEDGLTFAQVIEQQRRRSRKRNKRLRFYVVETAYWIPQS